MHQNEGISRHAIDLHFAGQTQEAIPMLGGYRIAALHLRDGGRLEAEPLGDRRIPTQLIEEIGNTHHVASDEARHDACQHYSCRDSMYVACMADMHDRLKQARLKAGYATKAAAARTFEDISESTYRAHENGQNEYDFEQARRYARRFGVSPTWLLFGEEVQAPEAADLASTEVDLLSRLANLPPERRKRVIEAIEAIVGMAEEK